MASQQNIPPVRIGEHTSSEMPTIVEPTNAAISGRGTPWLVLRPSRRYSIAVSKPRSFGCLRQKCGRIKEKQNN